MKTSTKIAITIAIAFIIILTVVVIKQNKSQAPIPADDNKVTVLEETSPVSTFTWRYQEAGEDKYGLPLNNISLDAKYENGKIVTIKVDQVQGSCNEIDMSKDDADIVKNSTKIQCYAAGFGQRYKIVKGINSYEVLRKYFVEAEPDSVPPDYKYEKVAEVPLLQ